MLQPIPSPLHSRSHLSTPDACVHQLCSPVRLSTDPLRCIPPQRLGEITWEQPQTKNEPPSPRSGHSITVVGDKAVFFGGCGISKDGQPEVFSETWLLSTGEPMTWELADVMGDVPSKRWRHTSTLLPDKESMLVFGGL